MSGSCRKTVSPYLARRDGLVGEAVGDVALGILRGGEIAVGLGKGLVERGRAGDEVRFEQGGLRLDVLARLHEDLVDGAGGMADLEVAVPEEVEDLVDEVFLQRLHDRRFGLRREEEHHVDVALRAEFVPAVAAEGDQADRGGQVAVGAAVRIEGVVEKAGQHDVDHRGAGLGDLEPGLAGVVMHADHRALQPQEGLAGGQALRRRAPPPGNSGVRGRVCECGQPSRTSSQQQSAGRAKPEMTISAVAGGRPGGAARRPATCPPTNRLPRFWAAS